MHLRPAAKTNFAFRIAIAVAAIEVERYNELLGFFQGCSNDEAANAADDVLTTLLTPPKKIPKKTG